jgi:glycosyltransferase involved in cell wall biosynthesis
MRMLLEAMAGLGDLDLLFLAPFGVDTSVAAMRRFEEAIGASWGLRLNAFIRDQRPTSRRPLRERLPMWFRCVSQGAVAFESEVSLNNSHEPSLRAVDDCLERGPDTILAFRLGTMAPLLRLARPLPPIFFDLDDAEHVKAMRMAREPVRLTARARAAAAVPILWWSEYRAMALARSTFVASTRDLERFRRFPRHSHRVVVPNAVSVPSPQPATSDATMLFIGNYVYPPNVGAVEYLLRNIWPRVKALVPAARLLIVGSEPDRIAFYGSRPADVEFPGFVDDLSMLYRQTRVVCCPIRVAGGTRIKILEAAAHGTPVVSTSIGAEGIGLRDGAEIFLRDDPASFADACVTLLRDASLSERIGAAARRTISERYERTMVIDQIRRSVATMLAAG